MSDYPTAHAIVLAPDVTQSPMDQVVLDYDARILRRKRLTCVSGTHFLVDLPKTTNLNAGDCLSTDTGLIKVVAADEPVLEITATDPGALSRLAWHIGNRHTPCQIEPDRLIIRQDHVLEEMLHLLGAHIHRITAPFTPEGGAYGHGRTMGHSH